MTGFRLALFLHRLTHTVLAFPHVSPIESHATIMRGLIVPVLERISTEIYAIVANAE